MEAAAWRLPGDYRFGTFRLAAAERTLFDGERPVRLGSRAFDILLVLVRNAGRVVSRDELMAAVWPQTVVLDANLNVHVSALRRALGGERYIVAIPGRGYSFVAAVSHSSPQQPAGAVAIPHGGYHNLPAQLTRLVGRQQAVEELRGRLGAHRLVTVVGPGGIGKTALALRVGEESVADFPDGVWWVDLAPVADAALVPSALAQALNPVVPVAVDSPGALAALVAGLGQRRLLLIVDNCEHLVGAAAAAVASVLAGAAGVRIVATSREPLGVPGEQVERLSGLALPAAAEASTAAQALSFAAVQLFAERAADSAGDFRLSDADAASAAEVCRRLDGVPLAIELAAARVDAFGVRGLAARLDELLHRPAASRRGGMARHQSIDAALEWSLALLAPQERAVFVGLAVFAGSFTAAAARFVLAAGPAASEHIAASLEQLALKSLLAVDTGPEQMRFRLPEATRGHAARLLDARGDRAALARRLATYHLDALNRHRAEGLEETKIGALFAVEIDNLRAALTWAFGDDGDALLGHRLAAATIPVWFRLGLLTECHAWMARAEAAPARRALPDAMQIQAAARATEIFTGGASDASYAAWTRAQADDEQAAPDWNRTRRVVGTWTFNIRLPDFAQAVALAQRHEAMARRIADAGSLATSEWMLGTTWHHLGELARGRAHFERFLRLEASEHRREFFAATGFDRRSTVGTLLGLTAWLEGRPREALRSCERGVAEARAVGYDLPICEALLWTAFTELLAGVDRTRVRGLARELGERAERHHLDSHAALAVALHALCEVRDGDREAGIEGLRQALARLKQSRYGPFDPLLVGELARASAAQGRVGEGLAAIADFESSMRNPRSWCLPELARRKAQLLAMRGEVDAAEGQYRIALALARAQDALSWELRSAIGLAGLPGRLGGDASARELLAATLAKFSEGLDTAGPSRARGLLDGVNGA